MIVSAPLLQRLDFFLQPPPKFSFTRRNFLYETRRNFVYETPSRWLLNWPAPSVNGCWFHARMDRNARNLKWLSRVHKSGRDWQLYRIWRQFLTHGNESALSVFKPPEGRRLKTDSSTMNWKTVYFQLKCISCGFVHTCTSKYAPLSWEIILASRQNTH